MYPQFSLSQNIIKCADCDSHLLINSDKKGPDGIGGIIGGSVVGALFFMGGTVTMVVVTYLFLRWRTNSRVKRLQMGIFTM